MITRENIIEKFKEYANIDEQKLYEAKFEKSEIALQLVIDAIYENGNILEQNSDNNLFIASMRCGIFNLTQSLVCIYIENEFINYIIYAEEGLVNQNIANGIIAKINKKIGIEDLTNSKKKINFKIVILIIVAIILVPSIVFILIFSDYTKKYNEAVNEYNKDLQEYKKVVSDIDVSNIESFRNTLDTLQLARSDIFSCVNALKNGITIEKIVSDTELVQNENIKLNKNIQIAKRINNPNINEIEKKVQGIEHFIGTEIVTAEEKASSLFNYDGIFKDCIYFALDYIDQNEIEGNTIVEKGTDAGGCIEIYEDIEKSRERYEYLMSFDNTIYYSGQFLSVGTMIIRTSYKLSNEEDKEITEEIIKRIIQ